ncbi:MAG: hypothetical protein SVK08_11135, partial [Halobacteriota archaeon]|nr:hypothetical protein [Halobacteriota archaeon]
MRTNATLLADQVKASYSPTVIVEYLDGSWTALANIVEVTHKQEAYGAQATIRINNYDGTYDSTDLRNKQVRIKWGANGTTETYPYLWGYAQEKISNPDRSEYIVYAEGAWNKLRRWTSDADYDFNQTTPALQNKNVKEIIDYIGQKAGLAAIGANIGTLDTVTETWEPEVTLYKGENGFNAVMGVLGITRCVLVPRTDTVHLKYPASGDSVDYTYVSDSQHFFRAAAIRETYFRPMKVKITTDDPYSGEFAHASWDSSHGVLELENTWNVIGSDADCVTMATGMVEKFEREAEIGMLSGPINFLQEIHDKITVTDNCGGASATGKRVGGI